MSKETRSITVLTDVHLITCVVQRGLADTITRAAKRAGAQGATVFFARGMGIKERLGLLGVAIDAEKEVVHIVVSAEQADRVFEATYLAGKLDTPGMGIMYMTRLDKAATFVPQQVIDNLDAAQQEQDYEA
jgi:nitrogen regulatory protein P-II 1